MRASLRRATLLLAVVVGLLATSTSSVLASPEPGPEDLRIVTAPAVAGAVFVFDGTEHTTDAEGQVTIVGAGRLNDLETRLSYSRYAGDPSTPVTFSRFYAGGGASTSRQVVAQFIVSQTVRFSFVNLDGDEVPYDRVASMAIKSSLGVEFDYTGAELAQPQVLPSARTVPGPTGLDTKDIYYTVQEVLIDGTDVVNRSQQRFVPTESQDVVVEAQFFHVGVDASDTFFGFATGDAVVVRWPDGTVTRHPVENGHVDLPLLPRGEYKMRVDGPGLKTWRPVSVSRDQQVDLKLISVVDIGAVVLLVILLAIVLIVVGQRRNRASRKASDRAPTGTPDGDVAAAVDDSPAEVS